MLPDRVSNPGPLTYESGALPIALRGHACLKLPNYETLVKCQRMILTYITRGYQKVLSLTWKEPEIWIYSALFFNVVPFQLHTLVPSSYPVINTRSVEVNILVP